MDDAGTLMVATPLARIDRLWRDEVSLNVTLFAGISAILLVILYAYYIQAKRARDADQIFAESNQRVETALSRGRCGLWDFDMPNRRLRNFDILDIALNHLQAKAAAAAAE